MRFRKGSKIEVLCKKDDPSGAWHSAEILSGNGRIYNVNYVYRHETDRVSRKDIRPCPPPLDLSEAIAPGDTIEVFENFSWKTAKILKGLGKNQFLVRLLGSSAEFVVSRHKIRVRRCWKDNGWIVIGKGSESSEDQKDVESMAVEFVGSPNKKKIRIRYNKKTGQIHLKDDENFRDSSTRARKRSSDRLVDANFEETRKGRGEKQCRLNAAAPVHDKYLHSVPDRTTGQLDLELNSQKRRRYRLVRICSSEESDGAESVGSCSIGDRHVPDIAQRGSTGSSHVINDSFSDAESSTDDNVEAEIHRLELKAYRSTMAAFHSLGPLSWENETLISNLRGRLNISNDEHLMVIKHLLSSGNKASFR